MYFILNGMWIFHSTIAKGPSLCTVAAAILAVELLLATLAVELLGRLVIGDFDGHSVVGELLLPRGLETGQRGELLLPRGLETGQLLVPLILRFEPAPGYTTGGVSTVTGSSGT